MFPISHWNKNFLVIRKKFYFFVVVVVAVVVVGCQLSYPFTSNMVDVNVLLHSSVIRTLSLSGSHSRFSHYKPQLLSIHQNQWVNLSFSPGLGFYSFYVCSCHSIHRQSECIVIKVCRSSFIHDIRFHIVHWSDLSVYYLWHTYCNRKQTSLFFSLSLPTIFQSVIYVAPHSDGTFRCEST